jgi:uncharacterized protein with HEPN domain
MPPTVEDRLSDIRASISQIERITSNMKMVDFGNLLRHAYQSTKTEFVWDIVQNDLPTLKAFVERSIQAPE